MTHDEQGPWYREEDDNLPSTIDRHVTGIVDRQRWVYHNMFNLLDMYIGCDNRGRERFVMTMPEIMTIGKGTRRQLARRNVARRNVDTLQNRTCSSDIKPMILASGGKWSNRVRAKRLEKYVAGAFYRAEAYRIIQEAYLMADICNIGYLMPWHDAEDSGDILLEHVLPWEIIVDEELTYLSGGHRSAREAFRCRDVPLEDLIERYPDAEEELRDHPTSSRTIHDDHVRPRCIRLYEAWRRKVGAGDGIYVATTPTLLLERTENDERNFPFVPVRWKVRPGHWIGLGAMEEVYSLQRESDRFLAHIQQTHDLHGDPTVLVDVQSRVKSEEVEESAPGRILEWDSSSNGRPPVLLVQHPVPQEFYQWPDRIASWIGEELGVSELANQGVRPAGNDISGFAYQVLDEIEGTRHTRRSQVAYDTPVELARRFVHLARQAYGSGGHKVKFVDRSFVELIDWSEAEMPDDEFHIRYYPASIFPDTPKGRIATAQELLKAGVSPEMYMGELYSPELETQRELDQAPVDCAHLAVDQMLYEGRYLAPSKYQDLETGMKIVNLAMLKADAVDGAPPEHVALLQRWLDEADEIRRRIAAEAAAQEQPPGAPQAGGPQAGGPTPADQPPVPQQPPQPGKNPITL